MKCKASQQRFLHNLKQENFFHEIEYDKLYPFGSAPVRIYGTLKMRKFSSSDSFPKIRPIVSSIGTFNYNLVRFLCDLLSAFLMITLTKILFLLFLKLGMQICPKISCFLQCN